MLPGIVGTWRLDGVQCESCHGPGARHARSSLREDISTRPDGCVFCHRQESKEGIPLVGDFLAPYTEAGWIRPFAEVQTMISVHRHAAWATFAVFVFEALLRVFIHTPLDNLGKLSNLGWFQLHPVNGLIGLALYTGKILAVRS